VPIGPASGGCQANVVACNLAGLEQVEAVETRYAGRKCIVGAVISSSKAPAGWRMFTAGLDLGGVDRDRHRQWNYGDRRPEL
jgi:hypothetical protein